MKLEHVRIAKRFRLEKLGAFNATRLLRAVASVCAAASLAAFGSPTLGRAECTAASASHRVALLELYTSEGCDSCPPADAWLASIAASGAAGGRVVPLAFHVDYWNYLGWTDPFSQPVFSKRQHDRVRAAGGRVVYTPQFLLNGKDYAGWRASTDLNASLDATRPPKAVATINLALGRSGDQLKLAARSQLHDLTLSRNAVLYVALFEGKLETQVAAGENRGRTLRHENVVRQLHGPVEFGADGTAIFAREVSPPSGWKLSNLGVAAFIELPGRADVLQAVALSGCP